MSWPRNILMAVVIAMQQAAHPGIRWKRLLKNFRPFCPNSNPNSMIRSSIIIVLAFLLSAGACKEKRQHQVQGMTNDEMRELLIESSKHHAQREDAVIETYVDGLNVKVRKTGTGLRYHVYNDRDSCQKIR